VSSELLINIDKNTSKSTISKGNSSTVNNTKEKKEGNSLFDSLMNEVKNTSTSEEKSTTKQETKHTLDFEEKSTTKQETKHTLDFEEKSTTKKETKNIPDSEEKNTIKRETQSSSNFELINNAKSTSLKEIPTDRNSIITSNTEITEEKKNISLKKLVEKLVDIVVNAAKDIFDNKKGTQVTADDLKSTIEKLVDNKISTIENKENVKSIINKKLDIVNSSVEIIKKEVHSLSINKNIETKVSKITLEEIIKDEVKIIKDSVHGIKKEILISTDIKEETSDIKKIVNNKSDNKKSPINDTISQIDKNLIIIDTSANEIENLITKIDVTETKDNTPKEELISTEKKIDYRIETIKEVIVDIKSKISEIVIVNTSKIENTNQLLANVSTDNVSSENSKKPLLATMFLNAQKTAKITNSLEQIKNAKSNIIDQKTIESVKDSAEKLDLNLEDTEIKHEEEKGMKPFIKEKVDELKSNALINNKTLNKVLINQKIEASNTLKEQSIINSTKISTIIKDQEKGNIESVEMVVSKEMIPSLQNKIIGAQQKMGSFMNEVARNMYLNYKPPVTAFRVNLNPANLGSISIIMKANKADNSLTVSMNLSNSNTMEAFTENKVALQNAIQRQFSESSNVAVDFNMDGQNSENHFNQNENNDNQDNNLSSDENEDTEPTDPEEKKIIENNDYM
jgi:hypothetical protein